MVESFNKDIFFNNISYLIKQQGKKIGDFENEAGVSSGYISRTCKDSKNKPGIDFIVKAANILKIDIDTLLSVDLGAASPTELYVIKFLHKLIKDTSNDDLCWECETKDYLYNRIRNDNSGMDDHPLFSLDDYYRKTHCLLQRPTFVSKTYDLDTYIAGDCYNLKMKNRVVLYVMDIAKDCPVDDPEPDFHVKEIWMCTPSGTKQYLCCDLDNSQISSLVDELYESIKKSVLHPKVKKEIRDAIDDFLNDDNDENFVVPEELPFKNTGGEKSDDKTSDS